MNVIVFAVIGLVVLFFAASALFAFAGKAIGILGSAFDSLLAILGYHIGRKHWVRVAVIPPELLPNVSSLPKTDTDRADFLRFNPIPSKPPEYPSIVFEGMLDRVFADFSIPSTQVQIESLSSLLEMSSAPPFEYLFDLISIPRNYPCETPTPPNAIEAPPLWTPWRPDFDEPSFTPPYYTGFLAFLNRFVDYAHRDEVQRLAEALERKQALLQICEKRNGEVEKLSADAARKHKQATERQNNLFDKTMIAYRAHSTAYLTALTNEQAQITELRNQCSTSGGVGLTCRIDLAMRTMKVPDFVSREGKSHFDSEAGILIHEHRFPDISELQWLKLVELKAGSTLKQANQKEIKETAKTLYPSLCLRLAAEIARLDTENIVKAIVINGWSDYVEKATGQSRRAYCASVLATTEQLQQIHLSQVDPVAAFNRLKGIAAQSLELTPIAPVIRLDKDDPRFVDSKEVLSGLSKDENLAAMDWEDFEHLCRELFERAFASSGAEVKVTQASRDQGVDAVIFDPDPLRGGKIIVQAKRYTNTVDVSAVRDLYGAVINEGATKGILVTTSHYGPDSYGFAKDKPITLLNGHELLGLLEKHGYKFRINLAEAKRMAS